MLEIRDLSLSYRTSEGLLPAVRSVDLVVRAGEVVGVVGESGCGKSTLASTVPRLQPKGAEVTGEDRVAGVDARTGGRGGRRGGGQVRVGACGRAGWAQATGLPLVLASRGMGVRSQRYSMLVVDGVVKTLNIEGPGKFEVSDATTMLEQAKAAKP